MARVTVEDCLDHVDNRFELVLVGAKRARQLVSGSDAKLPWENDKPTVMALREVAEGLVTNEILREVEQAPEEEEIIEAAAEDDTNTPKPDASSTL